MQQVKFTKRIFLPFFLLALFTVYQVSTVMFTHVHYVNGVMVAHSHPFTQKSHTHSTAQLIVLCHLSSVHSLKADIPQFISVERPVIYSLSTIQSVPCAKGNHLENLTLRAPPAGFCFCL